MRQWKLLRAGVLFAVLPLVSLSCGKTQPTEPDLANEIVAVLAPERFESSPQRESRELLIDARPTPIEWNIAGNTPYFLTSGRGGGGGDFYLGIRALWTRDRFGTNRGFYVLLQWPDQTANLLDRAIVNDSIDIFDDNGHRLVDCSVSDIVVRPTSWHRDPLREDEVTIEIFADSVASYPADRWRWGANTTNPVTPSNAFDFEGARLDGDSLGFTVHPAAAFAQDYWQPGPGSPPISDAGRLCYFENFTSAPTGVVPTLVAGKGSRDQRLNRGHQPAYSVWSYVAFPLTACTDLNPIRVDDGAIADKTWNPGDYVPAYAHIIPTESQLDVLARGGWDNGKWALELRRNLTTVSGSGAPRTDDLVLVPGRRYTLRVTIRDGQTGRSSSTDLIPLYLKP